MIVFLLTLALGLAAPAPAAAPTYVASVYDGDTLTLESGDKVRLRWVNTPEMKPHEPFCDEARTFTEEFVRRRSIQLAVSSVGRDSYGRIVAGVSTDQGDLSIGLLEAGLAHVFLIPPEGIDPAPLLAAEARARAARRGIWSTDAYQADLHLTSFHANAPGPDEQNVNGEYMRIANISGKPVDLSAWRLRDEDGLIFTLPDLVVPPGHTVQVRAGMGNHQRDPARQLVAYLGSETPIFNNDGARVELIDASGRAVDVRTHKGG